MGRIYILQPVGICWQRIYSAKALFFVSFSQLITDSVRNLEHFWNVTGDRSIYVTILTTSSNQWHCIWWLLMTLIYWTCAEKLQRFKHILNTHPVNIDQLTHIDLVQIQTREPIISYDGAQPSASFVCIKLYSLIPKYAIRFFVQAHALLPEKWTKKETQISQMQIQHISECRIKWENSQIRRSVWIHT